MAKVIDSTTLTDRVRGLAQFISEKKKAGKKFVLMLGAGASLSSGIKLTRTIMEEIVNKYAPESAADGIDDAFDKLWRESNADNRELMLASYLDGTPSPGYAKLAELIQLGFFDMVITFNFDRLLEKALDSAGFRDYSTIIRGETDPDAVPRLIQRRDPRVKILKIHGSLRSSDYFLFSKEEMLNYPEGFRNLFDDLTRSDIIICGYAFNDNCVIRAFNESKDSGAIYYINPSGATESIKGFLIVRKSQDKVISGDLGKFDRFFDALHQQLTRPVTPKAEVARQNVFKFLDHYDEDNKNWFFGRKRLTRIVVKRFNTSPPPRNLVLSGNPKVGKTSFVRAGLIPYLDKDKYECIFLRCRADMDQQVKNEMARRFPALAAFDWKGPLSLSAITTKKVVIFLDQFERPARFYEQTPDRTQPVFDFVKYLCGQQNDQLSVVFVAADDKSFWKLMTKLALLPEVMEIEPLSVLRVGSMIRHAARKGGVAIDAKMVAALCARYQDGLASSGSRPFSLMHVQTFCYYLAKGYQGPVEDDIPNQGLLVALSSISDKQSIIDMLEELPPGERKLIRGFLKVICDPRSNTKKIVEFIKDHFPDFQEDRFPEPIV